jgi:hypothetical protein
MSFLFLSFKTAKSKVTATTSTTLKKRGTLIAMGNDVEVGEVEYGCMVV